MSAYEATCPVCGYYCLGKGGYGCIDKPGMVAQAQSQTAPEKSRVTDRIYILAMIALLVGGTIGLLWLTRVLG